MQTWAFYNLKGGVGKTTTAVNIATLAARAGHYVLFWDLDPQGAATWYLKGKPRLSAKASRLVKGKVPIGNVIRETAYPQLDLIPSDFAYRNWDVLLSKAGGKSRLLADMLAPLGEQYSLIVLDCPPSLSALSDNVFRAADRVWVPVIPTPLSIRAYEQVWVYFGDKGIKRKRLYPFISMLDKRRSMHRDITRRAALEWKRMLSTAIPYSATIERMGEHRAPVQSFDPDSDVALAYRMLWHEMRNRSDAL